MTVPGLENPPTKNKQLLEWVEEMADARQARRGSSGPTARTRSGTG